MRSIVRKATSGTGRSEQGWDKRASSIRSKPVIKSVIIIELVAAGVERKPSAAASVGNSACGSTPWIIAAICW